MRSTPDLCDDHAILVSVADPIFTNFGGRERFGGEVVTVKCFEDNSLVKELVGTPGNDRVLVVDAGGSMRRACLGDRLAEAASSNGWAGIIIYGCIRDVDEIMATDIGVQALGIHPSKTDKKGVGEQNITVTFAGITVHPGDYLYADNNGIIVSKESIK
ncbi:MAG: ribonuclease E activity regulator RraA [Porticoccaceae bacterium]|tara:strand:- start:7995 stop:8471 length:477 start_codon:yes stop_codon:yes gene_type:complete